jgi:hypothetical protein
MSQISQSLRPCQLVFSVSRSTAISFSVRCSARGKIVTRFTGAMNVSFDANITNLIEISGRAGCSGYCRRQPSSG